MLAIEPRSAQVSRVRHWSPALGAGLPRSAQVSRARRRSPALGAGLPTSPRAQVRIAPCLLPSHKSQVSQKSQKLLATTNHPCAASKNGGSAWESNPPAPCFPCGSTVLKTAPGTSPSSASEMIAWDPFYSTPLAARPLPNFRQLESFSLRLLREIRRISVNNAAAFPSSKPACCGIMREARVDCLADPAFRTVRAT